MGLPQLATQLPKEKVETNKTWKDVVALKASSNIPQGTQDTAAKLHIEMMEALKEIIYLTQLIIHHVSPFTVPHVQVLPLSEPLFESPSETNILNLPTINPHQSLKRQRNNLSTSSEEKNRTCF